MRNFKEQAKLKNLRNWYVRNCSMCEYPLAYVFSTDHEHVGFDAGCDCTGSRVVRESSWGAVADNYNIQTDPNVIKKMNEFWGFNE